MIVSKIVYLDFQPAKPIGKSDTALDCEFEPRSWRSVLDTTLCDKDCHWLTASRWFSPSPPVSSTNKTDRHDISEILLKVALNIINQQNQPFHYNIYSNILLVASFVLLRLEYFGSKIRGENIAWMRTSKKTLICWRALVAQWVGSWIT
jgi:hypothetical protein